ncbi:MAG: hypothetical protein DI625_13235 [Sphingomonas sp.]|nr:MAG: hypothetical protein DI625_13235 [Sphingomonas sp.]
MGGKEVSRPPAPRPPSSRRRPGSKVPHAPKSWGYAVRWIPAFAGMTKGRGNGSVPLPRRSRAGGNP